MNGWYKIQIWINFLIIFCLYFWMLFSNGKIPKLEQKIASLDNKIEAIDYHIQNSSKLDTISVVINYPEKVKKK